MINKNAVDAWIQENRPSANHNRTRKLWLSDQSAANTRYGFLYWGLPSGLAEAAVTEGEVQLYNSSGFSGEVTVTLRLIDTRFSVNRVKWSNRPDMRGTISASVTKTDAPANTMWSFDVKAMLQEIADGAPWYGLRVEVSGSTAKSIWASEGDPDFRPTLIYNYNQPPEQPDRLSPDDTHASVAKPTLRWRFRDEMGEATQSAFQLRLWSTEALADANGAGDLLDLTHTWGIPQFDLDDPAAAAYAGLAAGSSFWWRVRVKDGGGLWSEWSEVAQYTRTTKGTLTITNPAVAPDNIVNETTPPFSWTFTGRTQEAYELILTTPETPALPLWTTGKITSVDTAVTPPPGKIRLQNKVYRLIVRIYDTIDRGQGIPDDPPYVEQVRDFTYELSSTVAPPTNFVGTVDVNRAETILTFDRATAPDYFVLIRDGITVDQFEPVEILVSGTSYRIVDKGAEPRKEHTWEVAAKVNGVTSSGNPSVTGITRVVAPMLSTSNGSRELFLLDPDIDLERVGGSEAVELLAGNSVLITQNAGKYMGDAAGILANELPGTDAETQLANFRWMADREGQVWKFFWIDKVLDVVMYNATERPLANPDGSTEYAVAFELFEV